MADESQVAVFPNSGSITVGETFLAMMELADGHYVLICNVPTHYQSGMRTGSTTE